MKQLIYCILDITLHSFIVSLVVLWTVYFSFMDINLDSLNEDSLRWVGVAIIGFVVFGGFALARLIELVLKFNDLLANKQKELQ